MSPHVWIVGPEYDAELFAALGRSLRSLGYTLDGRAWGVGGSQEISSWLARGLKGELRVEAETYVGLSVSGEAGLVEELRRHFTVAHAAIEKE